MSEIKALLDAAAAEVPGVRRIDDLRGDEAFVAEPAALRPFVTRLKELGFDFLVLVTASDNYLDEPRFDVTWRLRSVPRNADVRINVPVGGEDPEVDSVCDLYPAANWMERETWDMFGVRFRGHPNLGRILMWEGFEGHPLRKDYPLLGNTPGTPGYVGKGGKR
ncbi:MAG TPA: NADH-quinone oxidoreductase subunit C [Planctomycetota bacterium]|nr:NADH-quinone oxidoreductase subunit C [Planctomycetota bacterium]